MEFSGAIPAHPFSPTGCTPESAAWGGSGVPACVASRPAAGSSAARYWPPSSLRVRRAPCGAGPSERWRTSVSASAATAALRFDSGEPLRPLPPEADLRETQARRGTHGRGQNWHFPVRRVAPSGLLEDFDGICGQGRPVLVARLPEVMVTHSDQVRENGLRD